MTRSASLKSSLILFLLVLGLGPVHAGTPLKINFQGRLEESGQPAEGAKNFVFKIYDALAGGSLVWTSQAQSVPVANGAFSVVLEAGTPVNLSTAAFSGARYVEITVDGVPLSPRQEMVSAPYALVAQSLSSEARIALSNLEKDPSSPSTINTSTNAVDWSQLKNVPSAVADASGVVAVSNGGTGKAGVAANKMLYTSALNTFTEAPVTAAGLALVGGADAAAQRGSLELGILSILSVVGDDQITDVAPGKLSAAVGVAKGGTGLTSVAADNLLYTSGPDIFSAAPISAAGRALVGGADAAAQRAALGLGALSLTGAETDPVFAAHAAVGIGAGDITNWNNAFSWGNHSSAGYAAASALNGVAASTGTLTVNLAAEASARSGADTAISAQVNNVAASTGTLTVNLADLVLSTGPLANSGSWNGPLSAGGAISLPIKTVTADYMVTGNDSTIVVDAPVNPVTITLPSAAGIQGRIYTIKTRDITGVVTLLPQAGETIDGASDYGYGVTGFTAANDFVTCQSDGVNNWVIIGQWWAW